MYGERAASSAQHCTFWKGNRHLDSHSYFYSMFSITSQWLVLKIFYSKKPTFRMIVVLGFLLLCWNTPWSKSTLGRKWFICFILQHHCLSSKVVRTGTLKEATQDKSWCRSHGGVLLLACSTCFGIEPRTTSIEVTTYSGLSPTTPYRPAWS